MASGGEVLTMLIPTGGWVIYGNDFDSIIYDKNTEPITKEAFDAGFPAYDAWKAEEVQKAAATKSALLERLGITSEEVAILIG
jgi:hypothetical protein